MFLFTFILIDYIQIIFFAAIFDKQAIYNLFIVKYLPNSDFTIHIYSPIESASLCKGFEHFEKYSWRYCISKNTGIQKG